MTGPAGSLASAAWPGLARELDAETLNPGVLALVTAIASTRDLPERLANMALVFRSQGLRKEARQVAQAARRLAPGDFPSAS